MSTLLRPYNMFEDLYRPLEGIFNSPMPSVSDGARWLPPVDITKGDTCFTIEMEVPGFKRDEVNVQAHDGILSIDGERSSENESEENGFVRRERQYGKFSRRFSLPEGTTTDDINAEVSDGLLSIVIPHASPAEPKKIEVK